ncbi:MAG: glucose-6-phosphate dehydrogenase (NADP(+)), partial [Gammaproteobacteria bacterium]|nr:glucose-6-phosphate dehydrogenase (NADP(+)) [Gammaproteobacteria bacterium]
RDMLQNHMLQLLCLVAMEPPATLDPDSVRNEKVKVLRSLRPITAADVESRTVRGQYTGGVSELERVPGYLEESGGHESDTETFVALRLDIDNWRWAGVPFYLRTGKRMAERRTEIVIEFRDVPHSIFPGISETDLMANRLIISLQPREEISMSIMNKVPGIGNDDYSLAPLALNLSLTDAFTKQRTPIAYERLLLDVIKGNTTRFVRRDEVEASWEWVDGIIDGWQSRGYKVKSYTAGSWGPSAAIALAERNGHSWHE